MIVYLISQSTIIMIKSYNTSVMRSFDLGNFMTKSIEISSHDEVDTDTNLISSYFACHSLCVQVDYFVEDYSFYLSEDSVYIQVKQLICTSPYLAFISASLL